jgi:type IX secretion system PorP/SprF family membrane protein
MLAKKNLKVIPHFGDKPQTHLTMRLNKSKETKEIISIFVLKTDTEIVKRIQKNHHMERFIIAIVAIFLLVGSKPIAAQQDPHYSMYMFNPLSINPAYAGSLDQASAVGMFRKQWVNFPGAPQTALFSFHSPLKNKNVGLGFQFVNDQHGIIKTNGFNGIYAYHLKLQNSRISMALQAGANNFTANLSSVILNPTGEFDPAFAQNISQWDFNAGAGLFWYGEKFFVGASVPHIANNILSANEINNINVARMRTHAFLTGGYVFTLSPIWKLKPSTLLKYAVGAPLQLDVNLNAYFLDVVGIGVSYRTQDAVVAMLEVLATKQLRFGYAFDQTITKLRGYTGASHEFLLRYDFGFNKQKTITPRFF